MNLPPKRIAIIYYSHSGRTKEVAYRIRDLMNSLNITADIFEVKCVKEYGNNYLRMSLDALFGRIIEYRGLEGFDPSKYDLIVVGTPIWAGSITPPIRSFLIKSKGLMRTPIACFITSKRRKNYSAKFSRFLKSLGYDVISDISIVDLGVNMEDLVKFVEALSRYPSTD